MLIKQWTDAPNARHVLDDEDECEKEPLVPTVKTSFAASVSGSRHFGRVLVVPQSMAVLFSALDKKKCGSISIRYPNLDTTVSGSDYDEDEQLYSAVSVSALRRKYQEADVAMYTLAGQEDVLGLVVPHFANPIAEKEVARELVQAARSASSWVVLAPSQLNNGFSVCKLDLPSDKFPTIDTLRPPHFVTGIGAAVISALANAGLLDHASALVLNSEGHPGFEKVDADSIVDAAHVTFELLADKSKAAAAEKKLSQAVRKLNTSNTSGMYV